MNNNEKWSKNINYLRIAYGWYILDSYLSLREFAKILKVSESTLTYQWQKKGRLPSFPQLERLAYLFSEIFHTKITTTNLITDDIRDIIKMTPVPSEILALDKRIQTKLNEVRAMLFDRAKDLTYEDLLKVEEIINKVTKKE